MSEITIMRDIQVAATTAGHRLFRNNVGMGWTGKHIMFSRPMSVQVMPGDVLVRHARPLHAGLCEGSSDLIGWTNICISDNMVGKNIAIFTAVECKTPFGKKSDQQKAFIDSVNGSGGIGKFATKVEDLL